MTGCNRRLQNTAKGKLPDFYCSPNDILMIKSKTIIWVICIRQNGNAYWGLARKREGRRMLGRPRCR
jgi:hypothetical protein